jgi:acetyl esterase/lipase
MMLQFLTTKLSVFPSLISPIVAALSPHIPYWQRWRLLLLQPLTLLAALVTAPTWFLETRYTVIYIPTRSGAKRCLVFRPKDREARKVKPLHIDIHGGAFTSGFPEQGARFCALLSERTHAVVVSISYRFAPKNIYPAAHDDVDDIVSYLIAHASDLGADPDLLTVGGSSVGGGLALSASQCLARQSGQTKVPLAFVGFYPTLSFQVPPAVKSASHAFDPLSFLLPLFDVYAGTRRQEHVQDARLHPILAAKETLPKNILIIAVENDGLLGEQVELFERLKGEGGREAKVEMRVVKKGFHGFLERMYLFARC